MSSNLPTRPPDIDKLDSVNPIQPKTAEQTPEQGKFAGFMNEPASSSTNPIANPGMQGPSPMELAASGKQPIGAPPTLQDVQRQMQSVSGTLGDIKNQLHTRGLKLKQSDKYLLRSKLGAATDNIRSAASRAGVDVGAAPDLSTRTNPISKFLALVTDGQRQIGSAAEEIKNLDDTGQSVSAAKLLLIQAKLQKADQELNFTSALLGKATEMIKTLFNVQI